MKKCSVSSVLTRCQEQRCELTRGWENIDLAILPGCVRWEQPTSKKNNDIQSPDNISPLSASVLHEQESIAPAYDSSFPTNVSADDWVPEVDDFVIEEDDTPPLTSDSEDSDSDSDSEDDNPRQKSNSKSSQKSHNLNSVHRCTLPTTGPFSCPVKDCPKVLCKPWKAVESLHRHMVDHCVGKLSGSIPEQYFRTWNKQFCTNCSKMRKSFSCPILQLLCAWFQKTCKEISSLPSSGFCS